MEEKKLIVTEQEKFNKKRPPHDGQSLLRQPFAEAIIQLQ